MKILFIKLGSLGDIVHTLPALASVRSAVPNSTIGWLVEKKSAEILRGNPLIDHLVEIDTKSLRGKKVVKSLLTEFRYQLRDLRRARFDVALDFQGLIKSAALAKLSGASLRFGFEKDALREPASRAFFNRSIEIPKMLHVIRKNLLLAHQALDIQTSDTDFHFPIFTSNEHKHESVAIREKVGDEYALLNPAGGWPTKLWPAKRYGELADSLWEEFGLPSVISTGPGESQLAAEAIRACRISKPIAVQPSIKGFFEIARSAKVYVGGDTGPTHLAVAAGVPVVGIFGPTEWWRNGSPNPNDLCVERFDIDCRVDCHRRTCSNWICMEIETAAVVNAVKTRLGKESKLLNIKV